MKLSLSINGQAVEVNVDPSTPLLWVLRDHLNLTGTKYGCGMALCGACTVHQDGQPIRSCVTPAASVQNTAITTIEGLSSDVGRAVKTAWDDLAVVQCGYCQSGQVMAASALLANNTNPTDEQINAHMAGNICRCATYKRVRDAIKEAAGGLAATRPGSSDAVVQFYNAAEDQANAS
jgi:isoquinoline 1-oxidoreductase alpha subunit